MPDTVISSAIDESRDALARVIDPEAWDLYDDKRVQGKAFREHIVEESRSTATKIIESGLMASFEWDRKEYLTAKQQIIEYTSRTGKCESVSDLLDGYFKHDPRCVRWPDGAIGGSSCVK
jgi:hypothetical protein